MTNEKNQQNTQEKNPPAKLQVGNIILEEKPITYTFKSTQPEAAFKGKDKKD